MRKGLALPADCRDIHYPREAIRQQLGEVTLVYSLQIDESGQVTGVTFPQANTRTRPFERAAQTSLLRCKFDADGTKYAAVGEIVFRLKDE